MFLSPIVAIIKKAYANSPDLPFHGFARAIYRRLRKKHENLHHIFKPVDSTEPLRCNPESRTEIHTLTCHDHVFMYITAIKSLLRYASDVSVVVHDDGSLTPRDIARIEHHIHGIKVIKRRDADKTVSELLASFPKTLAYRAKVINSMELTDHVLLTEKERIIITNSDILFLRQPDDVIQWIAADDGDVLCVYEEEPYQQAPFLSRMRSTFPPHMTLALVCFYKEMVDPTAIEELLNEVDPADDPWCIGQNSLPVLIGRRVDKNRIRFLDRSLYEASGVFKEGAIFRHYWSSTTILNLQFFQDAGQVVRDLKAPRP